MLVHGLLRVTRDESAVALQISTGAVSKRYRLALEELHYLMNGGA
jgi:DNA-directed RNA polymerase specialized sigma24 family protein